MKLRNLFVLTLGLLSPFAAMATTASASVEVYVGYADGLRGPGFFPSPWQGDPGVVAFAGGSGGGSYDAGAILLRNSGAGDVTFNDLVVSGFANAAVFQLWGGFAGQVLHPGEMMIFTQTADFNFDTSDQPILGQGQANSNQPDVAFTVDGVTTHYIDTAQVLNTEGFDLASLGKNESHQWRLIGTTGGPSGGGVVPEPASIVSWSLLGLALGGYQLRRKLGR